MDAKRHCKICNQDKIGNYLKTGVNSTAVYADEQGRQWKAHVCPDCYIARRKEQRNKAKAARYDKGTSE